MRCERRAQWWNDRRSLSDRRSLFACDSLFADRYSLIFVSRLSIASNRSRIWCSSGLSGCTTGTVGNATDRDGQNVLVLSGKAGCIGELRVVDDALELVRTYPIATAKSDVPEGIAFDPQGGLWLVTDGEGMLRQIRLSA